MVLPDGNPAPMRASWSWNFAARIAWQATRRPDAIAIVDGDSMWTYREFTQRIDSLAAWLADQGVSAGDRVCVVTENRPDVLTAILALTRLAAVPVPTNWRLARPELDYIATHAGAVGIITQTRFASPCAEVAAACDAPFVLDLDNGSSQWDPVATGGVEVHDLDPILEASCGAVMADVEVSEGDLARIMYTSGTTSHPKGVMLSHGNVMWNCVAHRLEIDLDADDAVLLAAPLFHVGGLDAVAMATFFAGGRVVFAPSLDAGDIAACIETHRITSLGFMAAQTVAELVRTGTEGHDTSSLRLIISGGNTPEVLTTFRARYPHVRFAIGYGMTELTSGCTYSDYETQNDPDNVLTAGRPHPFMRVRVLDDQDRDVEVGGVGELVWAGPKVCLGYWRDPEATAGAFTSDGWFRSGDLGRVDAEGRVTFVDRTKDMLKSGGENVASAEVEAALLSHRAVVDVAVIGVPDDRWDEVPKAFVVLRENHDATAAELQAHVAGLLAKFKVPKHIEFATSLPRNHSGKVLKRELREHSTGTQTDQSVC